MKENTAVTIAETTKTMDQLMEELNAIRVDGSGSEISTLVNQIVEKCKEQTAENIKARISEILGMESDRVAMFTEFINNPMAPTVRMKQDPNTGEYSVAEGEKQISFVALEKAYEAMGGKTLAQSKHYYAMLTYFVDNLTRNIAGDLSEQVKKVQAPNLTTKEEKPAEYDFSGISVNALEAQLNALVSTILPAEMSIKMKRVDVKALKQAATSEKMMKFRMNDEARMLNKVFAAVRIRMNDEAYELTSKAKAHKAAKPHLTANEANSLEQETKMSKVPERVVPAAKKAS